MVTQSKTAGKIKTQITRFSNRLSSGLNKPKRKFLHQMIYGIQASKDIKLANIGRSLGEEIPLTKTENRLSRQINDAGLTEFIDRKLNGGKIGFGASRVFALERRLYPSGDFLRGKTSLLEIKHQFFLSDGLRLFA